MQVMYRSAHDRMTSSVAPAYVSCTTLKATRVDPMKADGCMRFNFLLSKVRYGILDFIDALRRRLP